MGKKTTSWFHIVSTYNEEVIEYWAFKILQIHLNQNYKL
jgi:hypothetical protein